MTDPFQPGLLDRLPEVPRKVVVVRAGRIGDFVCATPALRALRGALPDAEISFIGLPFVNDLVARSAHLDRFEAFPGFPGMADQFFDARRAAGFFQKMQAEQFDLAVQIHGSGVYSNVFTLLLGARWTAGFVRAGDTAGRLDAALPLPREAHEVHSLLALTTFLGAAAQGDNPELALWPEDHAAADRLLAAARPFLGIHPAARDPTKRWAPRRFAAVAAELRDRHGGTVVLLGGPEERPLLTRLAEELGEPCLNLAGRTSLGVLGGVIARLAVLVTNDSGPAHLAYALRTPTVTVFGSTEPARWGPLEADRHRVLVHPVACRPCAYAACPIGDLCLEGVTVRQAVDAAEAVMGPCPQAPISAIKPLS